MGKKPVQVYEALTNKMLHSSVRGNQSFKIPAKQAIMLVSTPVDQPMEKVEGRLICDGIVVDFQL